MIKTLPKTFTLEYYFRSKCYVLCMIYTSLISLYLSVQYREQSYRASFSKRLPKRWNETLISKLCITFLINIQEVLTLQCFISLYANNFEWLPHLARELMMYWPGKGALCVSVCVCAFWEGWLHSMINGQLFYPMAQF